MSNLIRVGILDDHQGIIDGYLYRLKDHADIKVTLTVQYGEELEAALSRQAVEVLLLDVHVPTSAANQNPYPILYLIPKLLQKYPQIYILVISMDAHRTMIKAAMESGVSGYMLKDDKASILNLAAVIRAVARGSIYLSQSARQKLQRQHPNDLEQPLTQRQLEALSLSGAYPEASTVELANRMGIAHSTVRNLLSGAYMKLNVSNRTAALARARQLGLIADDFTALDMSALMDDPD